MHQYQTLSYPTNDILFHFCCLATVPEVGDAAIVLSGQLSALQDSARLMNERTLSYNFMLVSIVCQCTA